MLEINIILCDKSQEILLGYTLLNVFFKIIIYTLDYLNKIHYYT